MEAVFSIRVLLFDSPVTHAGTICELSDVCFPYLLNFVVCQILISSAVVAIEEALRIY